MIPYLKFKGQNGRLLNFTVGKLTERLSRGVQLGLNKAGLMIQRESQLQVPVHTGALKASAFTRSQGQGFETRVAVGYTASYAIYVHEAVHMKLKGMRRLPNPPNKGRYWDPQGRAKPKFLEDPIYENKGKFLTIVRDTARRSIEGGGS